MKKDKRICILVEKSIHRRRGRKRARVTSYRRGFIYRIIVQEFGVKQRNDTQVLERYLHVQVAGLPLIVSRRFNRRGVCCGEATGCGDNEETKQHDRHRGAIDLHEVRLKNAMPMAEATGPVASRRSRDRGLRLRRGPTSPDSRFTRLVSRSEHVDPGVRGQTGTNVDSSRETRPFLVSVTF